VRRTLIQHILPLAFCAVPVLAGVLVVAAIPSFAREFYFNHIIASGSAFMDWLILALGAVLFVSQEILAWRALQWRGTKFDERPDRWLNNLAQAAEWFPMLGLLGTVGGILQTFANATGGMAPEQVIHNYAPAITATGSGLFCALLNILPTWIVVVGRQLILTLGGGTPGESEEAATAPYSEAVGSERR
jgi:MotA/TolQ/ExbB proton channel family